jgi:ferredoxin--NADP+ reductase
MTRSERIRTLVSLNPIMIDGTGMCGGCRVLVDNKSQFACVDGPEFDAHQVNFAVLVQRNGAYRTQEQQSLAEYRRALESHLKNAGAEGNGACAAKGVTQ